MFKLSLQLQKAAQHLRGTTLNVTAVLATLVLLVVPRALAATTATNSCQLKSPKGAIQHVIYVQFDNTHFRRDNPDIPSDLEQMPHLLNFIQDNGVLMSNDHTVLISHTATGILTSLTGVYPDRMGQPVSNSFRYFKTDGTTRTGVSFAYWTAPLFDPAGSTTDTTPEMTGFAWNHGDIQDEIASTWVGYVGQGVDPAGVDSTTWSDHTDVRPTILELVGLNDDYVHDGRVISEILEGYARPLALKKSSSFVALAQVYKQLNAPFGAFAMATLRASTKALASNDADDATYNSIEGQIQALTTQRNTLAAQMISLLDGAEFNGQTFSDAQAQSLIGQGQALLNQANALPH